MSKPCDGQCGSEDSVVNNELQSPVTAETDSQLSTYSVPKMDCPSEERMELLSNLVYEHQAASLPD